MRILDDEAEPTYVGAEDNDVYKHEDIGFADDKESASHSAKHIQDKAELFSAFNIVFGLQFSEAKIRRVLQNFLPNPHVYPLPTMFIYKHGWTPVAITITTSEPSKYLGGIYNPDNQGRGALEEILKTARLHCHALLQTRFSAEAKIAVATTSTINKLRFIWEASSLQHDQAAEIDAVIDQTYVNATRNMQNFPRKLLHIPRQLGGLGLVQFSAKCEAGKLSRLIHGLRTYQLHGKAAKGILSREARKMGYFASTGQGFSIVVNPTAGKTSKQYADGPCQWLALHSMTL